MSRGSTAVAWVAMITGAVSGVCAGPASAELTGQRVEQSDNITFWPGRSRADRSEDLAQQADGGDARALLRRPSDLPEQEPVDGASMVRLTLYAACVYPVCIHGTGGEGCLMQGR